MKHLLALLLVGCPAPLFAQSTAADSYKKAEIELKAGNIDQAKALYQETLRLEPNHGNAKFRLLSMRDLTAEARIRLRKAQMEAVILPNVTFDEMTLEESLEALGAMIEKASEETLVPNFVIADPSEMVAKNKVTLRLRNIPATVALKYVLQQAKASEKWDAHVITVRPLGQKAATTDPEKEK